MGENADFALILVLGAAFLHALWNAIIKGAGDHTLSIGLIALPHVGLGAFLAVTFLPPLSESWPFIAASTVIHFFYYAFLIRSYKIGDLSQVYPISRGIAPVLVTLGAMVFTGEFLTPGGWIGVLLVSLGVTLPTFFSQVKMRNNKAVLAALATGVFIASYSVVDGMGVRLSGSPLGYIGWLFVCEIFVIAFIIQRRWRFLLQTRVMTLATGLFGGIASASAYGLVIYAKTLAPLGTISAVRESSVVIAALIGVLWFRERPWEIRLVSAFVVAGGVLILAFTA